MVLSKLSNPGWLQANNNQNNDSDNGHDKDSINVNGCRIFRLLMPRHQGPRKFRSQSSFTSWRPPKCQVHKSEKPLQTGGGKKTSRHPQVR